MTRPWTLGTQLIAALCNIPACVLPATEPTVAENIWESHNVTQ